MGEIAVSGAIADGYLDDPELTLARFGPAGERAYRTGDLARRLPDGSLVHMGRADSQVQVRGNRVELVEIEHTLASHPRVRQAVVTWAGERLVAAVELADRGEDADEAPVTPAELRAFVDARLPAFMVPHRIETAELPRTPAGKADRLALHTRAASPGTRNDRIRSNRAPPTRSWRCCPRAGPRCSASTPRPTPTATSSPWAATRSAPSRCSTASARDWAGTCRRSRSTATGDSPISVAPCRRRSPRRRPPPQSARPATRFRSPRSSAASTWRSARAAAPRPGPLTSRWTDRSIETPSGAPRSCWSPGTRPCVPPPRSLRPAPPSSASSRTSRSPAASSISPRCAATTSAARLAAEFEQDATTAFNPSRPPLFSIRLLRTGPERHIVALAAHHIIADAWSCFSLLSELGATHDAFASGDSPRLPDLTVSFRELACAEPVPARDEDRAFWRAALAGIDQQPAPAGPARSTRVELPRDVLDALRDVARARGTSPFAAVLGMFADAIGRATARDDLVVSIAISGRSSARDAAARVVGPLARGLPVRLTAPFSGGDVARALDGALAHGDAPAPAIAAAAGTQALARLGRYVLSWLDPDAIAPLPSRLRPDWSAAALRFDASTTGTEVMLGVVPHAGGLTLHLHGGELVHAIAPAMAERLTSLVAPDAALIVQAPAGAALPGAEPVVIERVRCALGLSELILLPLVADAPADLDRHVVKAIARTRARVVALAGMLPSHLGLDLTWLLHREPRQRADRHAPATPPRSRRCS